MYGTEWCPDCHRSQAIFKEYGVEYEFIDVDKDEEAAQKVMGINNGKRIVPTIIINGVPHTNPDYLELKALLKPMRGENNS